MAFCCPECRRSEGLSFLVDCAPICHDFSEYKNLFPLTVDGKVQQVMCVSCGSVLFSQDEDHYDRDGMEEFLESVDKPEDESD